MGHLIYVASFVAFVVLGNFVGAVIEMDGTIHSSQGSQDSMLLLTFLLQEISCTRASELNMMRMTTSLARGQGSW